MLKNEYLRAEAEEFFGWCRFNLNSLAETLAPDEKAAFKAGEVTESLLCAVRTVWLKKLERSLSWADRFAAVRKALPRQKDYDEFVNCPPGQVEKLPRGILRRVRTEEARKVKENHAAFLANGGLARVRTYLRVWQSESLALNKLIIAAWGYKQRAGGGARLGPTEIDIERMMVSEAEATGSAMKIPGLLPFIRSLWENEKTILVKTNTSAVHPSAADWGPGFERRVVPNPDMSEMRLNRFLVKLGRALAASNKRRALPDWPHMDQRVTLIVHGWCESIIVAGQRWPLLCLLSTPALVRFLSLCDPPLWKKHQDPRTLERRIARLGLIRIPNGRIKLVEKKGDGIYFS